MSSYPPGQPMFTCAMYGIWKDGDYDCDRWGGKGMKTLLEEGADPNTKNSSGETTLSLAVRGHGAGSVECVKLLVEHGADPYIQDEHNRDAMWHAKRNDNTKIIKILDDRESVNTQLSLAKVLKDVQVDEEVRKIISHNVSELMKVEHGFEWWPKARMKKKRKKTKKTKKKKKKTRKARSHNKSKRAI